MGGVYPVKPVGVYAMIDDGELDWKVIAISTADPKADAINDVEDVERCAHAGILQGREAFRAYTAAVSADTAIAATLAGEHTQTTDTTRPGPLRLLVVWQSKRLASIILGHILIEIYTRGVGM